MYQSPTSLKPLLRPVDYCSAEVFDRELACVFFESWHLVGTTDSVPKSGDFLSAEVSGVPLLVRNFDGTLVALRNVCAHRQCRLVSAASGHSDRLKCPYHGWEYGNDGRTRKIPGAANFPHFDREQFRLQRFAVEQCGQLIFVRLSETGPTLQEWMGEIYEKVRGWFDQSHWRVSMTRRLDYPANWKIPVEISLESYHIPEVHPQTFGEDPGESLSEHWFHSRGSAFYTQFLAPRRVDRVLRSVERWLLKRLGDEYTGRYEHHHLFPNLTISHTDSLTLAQSIIPVSPQASACLAIQVGVRPARPGAIRNFMAAGWGRFTAWLTRQILNEDRAIYQEVQAGVQGGSSPGLLGRCEERLEAFQRHVRSRLDAEPPVNSSPVNSSCHDAGCSAADQEGAASPAPVLANNAGGRS